MKREKVKGILPILQAFAEGRTIQTKNGAGWIDINDKDDLNIESIATYPDCFRIKPEPKYCPFNTTEECWQEKLKHKPFGWIKEVKHNHFKNIIEINDKEEIYTNTIVIKEFKYMFDSYVFADGKPFGKLKSE